MEISNTEAVFYDLNIERTDAEKEEMVDEIAILYFYGVNVNFVPAQSTVSNKLSLFLLEKTNGWFAV